MVLLSSTSMVALDSPRDKRIGLTRSSPHLGRGLIFAAPASGSGKTVVTAGLLRHLRGCGASVAAAKAGPDFIDPTYHAVASGKPCLNLDVWAMRRNTLAGLVAGLEATADLICAKASWDCSTELGRRVKPVPPPISRISPAGRSCWSSTRTAKPLRWPRCCAGLLLTSRARRSSV